MSESAVGMLLLFGVAVVTSVIAHLLLKKFVVAWLTGALASALVFEGLVFLQLGHLDKLVLVATAVAFLISMLVSAVVGFGVRRLRTHRQDSA